MIIEQIKVVDKQISLRKVGTLNIITPEVSSEISLWNNTYSSMNGQGNRRGKKGDTTSIPNSGTTLSIKLKSKLLPVTY